MFIPMTSREYREVFGPDYYRFQVKGVTFLVIDSQLLGNFDNFDAQSPQPMPPQTEAESQKMLSWLSRQAGGEIAADRQAVITGGIWVRAQMSLDGIPITTIAAKVNPMHDDRQDNNDDGGIVIGIQHIPAARGDNMPPDPKPYWVVNEPYRSRELDLLHRLGSPAHACGPLACGKYF